MAASIGSPSTQFGEDFRQVLLAATDHGTTNEPLSSLPGKPFRDERHHRRFMSACHRGFERAQNRIVDLIDALSSNTTLTSEERRHQELTFRRVIDGIAFTMLRTEGHIARRLILHDSPPPIDISVLRRTQREANRLNQQSRLSVALIADLSTFIHLADILRIDHREPSIRVDLIELKDGTVNTIIAEQLAAYSPTQQSLERLRSDTAIDRRHRPQAERILRQKVRLQMVEEIISHDEGIDPKLNVPIKLLGPTIRLRFYDEALSDLSIRADAQGCAAATIDHCLHVGVAYDNDRRRARGLAGGAAKAAMTPEVIRRRYKSCV